MAIHFQDPAENYQLELDLRDEEELAETLRINARIYPDFAISGACLRAAEAIDRMRAEIRELRRPDFIVTS